MIAVALVARAESLRGLRCGSAVGRLQQGLENPARLTPLLAFEEEAGLVQRRVATGARGTSILPRARIGVEGARADGIDDRLQIGSAAGDQDA